MTNADDASTSSSIMTTGSPKKQPTGYSLVNRTVKTAYGPGKVVEFRNDDQSYAIELLPGGGGGGDCSITKTKTTTPPPVGILYTCEVPEMVLTPKELADEINTAYVALEKMRRLNLEVTMHEHGIDQFDYDHCTECQLLTSTSTTTTTSSDKNAPHSNNRFPRLQKFRDSVADQTKESMAKLESTNRLPRIRKLWNAAQQKKADDEKPKVVLPRIQKLLDERQKASASPCLICASASCSRHSSKNFRKEGITLCLACERLFELNFIVDCVSNPNVQERAKLIDHMIDCYDRCLLLLNYSSQFIDGIATSLEQQKEKQNKIGLGSSGVGVLSGVLGIAAAATILTPAGPPLLVASLFFGGSATAVQTGTEAMNYFSEPNKLADRMIALHGMVLSILRVTSTLRDAMLRDHIRTADVFEAEAAPLSEQVQEKIEKNRTSVIASANMGRTLTLGGVTGSRVAASSSMAAAEGAAVAGGSAAVASGGVAVAGAEATAVAGARTATIASRSATAAARTVRFARFAGGALSAAVLVMEANAIQSTLKSIEEGNPCDKAKAIRQIAQNIKQLPTTADLDEECQAYLEVLASRPVPPPEVSAEITNAPSDDIPQAECKMAPMAGDSTTMREAETIAYAHNHNTAALGALIVEGEATATIPVATAAATETAHQQQSSSSSFLFGGAGSAMLQSAGSSMFQRLQASTQAAASHVSNASSGNRQRPMRHEDGAAVVADNERGTEDLVV